MSDKETAQMKTVSADDLRQVETEIFEKQGFSHEHAAIVADSLLEADLRGVSSHGAIRIPVLHAFSTRSFFRTGSLRWCRITVRSP
mgnify:CR=1 FL=1